MLYSIARFLKNNLPWFWDQIDAINSYLFMLRYGKKMNNFKFSIALDEYKLLPLNSIQAEQVFDFFARQPNDAFIFFKPHNFDIKTIKKLQRNKAFLAYVLVDIYNEQIVGYCFNRSFFHGKGFRGRMVDINYRGKGVGTIMNKLLNEVGFGIGLRLFETVSKDNIASYRSAIKASSFRIEKELPNNELYLEILKD